MSVDVFARLAFKKYYFI